MVQIKIGSRSEFYYGIGLLATDGSLSSDGRHIEFTSKDIELVKKFKKAFHLKNKIGKKSRCNESQKKYYRVQFGNIELYRYFIRIGLHPDKSLTLGSLDIPRLFFPDFLRGVIDGDGSIGFFKHPESQYKQFRIRITSASQDFLEWLNTKLESYLKLKGKIITNSTALDLCFYKENSFKIVNYIYNSDASLCLRRKYNVAKLIRCEGGGTGRRASLRS